MPDRFWRYHRSGVGYFSQTLQLSPLLVPRAATASQKKGLAWLSAVASRKDCVVRLRFSFVVLTILISFGRGFKSILWHHSINTGYLPKTRGSALLRENHYLA